MRRRGWITGTAERGKLGVIQPRGDDTLSDVSRSDEAYLQMWQRAAERR